MLMLVFVLLVMLEGVNHKEISPSPQYQLNQTCCTAGDVLLTWCAGLWARAQACHKTLTV